MTYDAGNGQYAVPARDADHAVCCADGVRSEPHQAAGQGRPAVLLAPAHAEGL